jgi:metallo-beta-lactamase family protein
MQLFNRAIILGLFFAAVQFLFSSCAAKVPAGKLKVTVFGAAEQVSGSMTLMEVSGKKILIDCGLFYPDDGDGSLANRQEAADDKNEALPIKAESLDAVIITHAHLDHIGRVPLLVESGFNGKIFCTQATKDILDVMLISQIRYDNRERNWVFSKSSIKTGQDGHPYVTAHWNNCKWQKNIKQTNLQIYKGHRTDAEEKFEVQFSPCKLCAENTLAKIIPHLSVRDFDIPFDIDPGLKVTYLYSGHIPGSASVLLEVNPGEGNPKKLLFSGDLGNSVGLLQNGPAPAPEVDALWVESTYGGISREIDAEEELVRFRKDIADALNNDGIAWIPAFALDRTQKILFEISEAKKSGIIPDHVQVFCPSPSAHEISKHYIEELKNKQNWFKPEIYLKDNVFSAYSREFLNEIPRPAILITTSGMMDAAYSAMLGKKLLPDSSVTVFLVGYQDPGTPGGQIKSGQKFVEWKDEEITVNARVNDYKSFSAHPDARELEEWLSRQNKETTAIFLVHGNLPALEAQKNLLESIGFKNVIIPKEGAVSLLF